MTPDPFMAGGGPELFALENERLRVRLTNLGATVISIEAPDRFARMADVVLGFDSPEDYTRNPCHFGCTVGRVANRIRNARFVLDGREYRLSRNAGSDSLHGGPGGFHARLWEAEVSPVADEPAVTFRYLSRDGEEGYPGDLSVSVTFVLLHDGALQIDYEATTNKPTPVNLSHHSYFNLSGRPESTVLDHLLWIDADRFTPVDASQVPVGEIASVTGTPLDFRAPTRVGERIHQDFEQLRLSHGYDLNWVLDKPQGAGLALAAKLFDPASGRLLECLTTEPGIQVYSGNFLDGSIAGKGGVRYRKWAGLCLETQHFPDSPNIGDFPSTILRPGRVWRSRTVYRFSVG